MPRKPRRSYHDHPDNLSMPEQFKLLTELQQQIITALAHGGKSTRQIAKELGCSQPYISSLLNAPEHKDFRSILDWVSLKQGMATPAARVRYINQVLEQFTDPVDGHILTKKDPLEWLKMLQEVMSEFPAGNVRIWDENQFDLQTASDDDLDGYMEEAEEILATNKRVQVS